MPSSSLGIAGAAIQVAEQVLDVIQYCIGKEHVLWDVHGDDVLVHLVAQNPVAQPKVLLLDVFMPPDPILGQRTASRSVFVD